MALNAVMLDSKRSPVPLPHEMGITNVESGVELVIAVPDSPSPSCRNARSSPESSAGLSKRKAAGRLWLTGNRLIFVAEINASFESLTVPLLSILSTKFVQPTFGSNYLTFDIKPSHDGGLTDGTVAELRFKNDPMFEFVSLLEKTRERVIYMKRQEASEEETLPTYTAPKESESVEIIGGASVENPPQYDD